MFRKLVGISFALLWALALTFFPLALSAQAQPPNIVLIIGDDQGWTDFGFMPSSRTLDTNTGPQPLNQIVQTPNLDALAAQGVLYRNAHVTSSTCRASLLTLLSSAGMQPLQWIETRTALAAQPEITLPNNAPFFFPRREAEHVRTVPRELGHAGYKSWEGGKYWESTFEHGGFTHGLAIGNGTFFEPDGWDFGRVGWDPALCANPGAPTAVCPALDPLRTFLDEVQSGPFFVWFAPQIPHSPFDAPQNFRDPYEALGLETCADNDCGGLCMYCPNEVNYLSNVTWFDALVGELMDELDGRGLLTNTLVIYITDNGWGLNMQYFAGSGQGKGTLYEMGFRTPVIFSWPGVIPAGGVYDDLVSATDIAPTILDYAGVDTLPEQEGESLRAQIEGGLPLGRTELIGLDEERGHFLRTDTWRYLRFASDSHEELYQIDIDPLETNDVSAQNPALVTQFAASVDAWELARRTPPSLVEITGRLLNELTGAPLKGSQVMLDNGTVPLISIAGEDGWFRFGPVDPNSYVIRADARTANLTWLSASDPVPAPAPVGLSSRFMTLEATQTVALAGSPFGSQIRGTLTDNMGSPLPNVPVLVQGTMGCDVVETQVLTQADGSYRTENLPFTTYTITATTPPGYQDVVVTNVVIDELETLIEDLVALPD